MNYKAAYLKSKEIIEHQEFFHDSVMTPNIVQINYALWNKAGLELKSELAALEAGIEKEEKVFHQEFCDCSYKRPHTYGGTGQKICINCNKWIKNQ